MTFQRIKEEVVENQKRLTVKELVKLVINLALAFIGICITLGLLTYAILGFAYTVIIILCAIFAYNLVFDIFVEDEKVGKHIVLFSKLWWIEYILIVIVFLILKLFGFL